VRLAHDMPGAGGDLRGAPLSLEVPEQVTAAKQRLATNGFSLEPAPVASSPDNAGKYAMLACYRSQLPCLGERADIAARGPRYFIS